MSTSAILYWQVSYWYNWSVPAVSCKICSKEFYSKPSWLLKGAGKYCSRTCQQIGRKTGGYVFCSLCSKEVYKQKKALLHSKSGKLFCSLKCSNFWHNTEFVGNKHANWKNGICSYRKTLKRTNRKEICILCKISDQRILSVHHIDENRKNNKVSNLSWLCRNCHHLVHNYSESQSRFKKLIKENIYDKKV